MYYIYGISGPSLANNIYSVMQQDHAIAYIIAKPPYFIKLSCMRILRPKIFWWDHELGLDNCFHLLINYILVFVPAP